MSEEEDLETLKRKNSEKEQLLELLLTSMESQGIKLSLSTDDLPQGVLDDYGDGLSRHTSFLEEEESEEEEEDDDDGPPPPPPPDAGEMLEEPKTPEISLDKVKFLQDKAFATEDVKLGKIAKKKFKGSVFDRNKMLSRSEGYFKSDTIKRTLFKHFEKSEKKKGKKGKKKQKDKTVCLVDGKKTMMASIVLKNLDTDAFLENFRTAAGDFDTTSFEKIVDLCKLFQGEAEKEKVYAACEDDEIFSQLSPPDQFVVRLFKIPLAMKRLEVFKILFSYKDTCNNVKGDVAKFLETSVVLKRNEEFKEFLVFVLGIANFLAQEKSVGENEIKAKDLIFAINVRSLSNLAKVKSHTSDESLLDVIYRLILHKNPKILEFMDRFAPCQEIAGIKIAEKRTESDAVKKDLLTLEKTMEDLQKNVEEVGEENFENLKKRTSEAIPFLKCEIQELENMFAMLDENYKKISVLYAQDVAQMDSFLVDVDAFLTLIKECKITYEKKSRLNRKFDSLKRSRTIDMRFKKYKQDTMERRKRKDATKRSKSYHHASTKRKQGYLTLFRKYQKKNFSKFLRGKFEQKSKKFEKIEVLILDNDTLVVFRKDDDIIEGKIADLSYKLKGERFINMMGFPLKVVFKFKTTEEREEFVNVITNTMK